MTSSGRELRRRLTRVNDMQIESIYIEELMFDPSNVRTHNNKNLDAIKGSLAKFGQQKPIVINAEGVVIAGNGTLAAAKALGWQSLNVVRTGLEGSDATAYAIADNRTADLAEWDDGALAEILSALQIEDESLVDAAGFSSEELTEMVDELAGQGHSNYTRKIEAPIYEPTGEKPSVSSLLDDAKTQILKGEITDANIPEEVALFLLAAAERHTKFNFSLIANFYANTEDEKIRGLFRKSALVIIDFDEAIELGFVKLTKGMEQEIKKQASDG